MRLQDLTNSAAALRLAMGIGRFMPPRLGYALADGITALLARRESAIVRAMRANLRVVYGPEGPDSQIELTMRAALRHAGHVYYDLYSTLAQGEEAFATAATFSPQTESFLQEAGTWDHGAVVVTGHMSAFDMAGLALAIRGLPVQILSYADPTSGYRLQNQFRSLAGLEIAPIDVATLRKSLRRLRTGGLVLTGVDRPDPFGSGELVPFFGRPARLPVGHVRLALQTGVPVVMVTVEYRPTDRRYVVHVVRTLEMEHVGDRQEDLVHNAGRVLAIQEQIIRARPEQWMMFYPVWD